MNNHVKIRRLCSKVRILNDLFECGKNAYKLGLCSKNKTLALYKNNKAVGYGNRENGMDKVIDLEFFKRLADDSRKLSPENNSSGQP